MEAIKQIEKSAKGLIMNKIKTRYKMLEHQESKPNRQLKMNVDELNDIVSLKWKNYVGVPITRRCEERN